MNLSNIVQGNMKLRFMKKILVVEDDIILNSGLCYNLQLSGYNPEPAYKAKTAINAINRNSYELIILDVNLNDGNGFDICRSIRKKSNVPVVFLTSCDLDEEIMKGFEIGADDYVTKPFNINIFMKKVDAILRRYNENQFIDVYEDDTIKVDFSKLLVVTKEKNVNLTPTEGRLIKIFISNKGQVLTRKTLLEKLWDYEGNFVDEHTLTVNINRLRNKIDTEENKYIKTIYGMGYMWSGEK